MTAVWVSAQAFLDRAFKQETTEWLRMNKRSTEKTQAGAIRRQRPSEVEEVEAIDRPLSAQACREKIEEAVGTSDWVTVQQSEDRLVIEKTRRKVYREAVKQGLRVEATLQTNDGKYTLLICE